MDDYEQLNTYNLYLTKKDFKDKSISNYFVDPILQGSMESMVIDEEFSDYF